MKKSYGTLIIAVLVVSVLGSAVDAQEGDRRGELRGLFVRLAERRVGDQGYLGIVVRPFEQDEHYVVLVPREHEDLAHSARMMREGDRLEVSYVREHGEMWIDRIAAERRRAEGQGDPEEGRRIEIRREEIRRRPEPMEERREGERTLEVRREIRREGGREDMEARREGERRIIIRREGEPGPEARREERMRREPPPHEQLEGPLREVIARHMERMGVELKEILGFHVGRMHEEMQELRAHAENMRRELEELRARSEDMRRELELLRRENQMLQVQLRERGDRLGERDRGPRERRDPDRPRGDRERVERGDPESARGDRERPVRRNPDRPGDDGQQQGRDIQRERE